MGKSGSGKTTADEHYRFLGSLNRRKLSFFRNRCFKLSENKKSAFRNEYLGFIFQQFFLINSLNVSQNVQLPVFMKEKSRAEKSDC